MALRPKIYDGGNRSGPETLPSIGRAELLAAPQGKLAVSGPLAFLPESVLLASRLRKPRRGIKGCNLRVQFGALRTRLRHIHCHAALMCCHLLSCQRTSAISRSR